MTCPPPRRIKVVPGDSSKPLFRRHAVAHFQNESGDGPMNTFFTVGDVNGDGLPDIVSAGRNGNVAWFENPGRGVTFKDGSPWKLHTIDRAPASLECGGTLHDLTGDGSLDVINGGDWNNDELYWWKNPARAANAGAARSDGWQRSLIIKTGLGQFHDEIIGDVTGDGVRSIVFWNNRLRNLWRIPLPRDPAVSPWPGAELIATGLAVRDVPEEGLAIADLDGDGQNELIAGTHWYKFDRSRGYWRRNQFALGGYVTTVLAIGDVDGDGKPEIVVAEGDSIIWGKGPSRVAIFKGGDDLAQPWAEHLLAEGLSDAHTLQLGDIFGAGRLDIVVGEIGIMDKYLECHPKLQVFENLGDGSFARHVVEDGVGSHHGRLADVTGNGKLDIVTRPLHGKEKWDIFVYENLIGA